MESFDVLVIGSGSGMIIVSAAISENKKIALVENGRMGGTCLNRDCVPSKMLLYPADVAVMLREASQIGVNAELKSVDFNNIMTRMHRLIDEDSTNQAKDVEATPNLVWYKQTGQFIKDYVMQIGDQTITAKIFFIVSGARTEVPPIKGLQETGYLTSDTVLELKELPKSIVIVGGGYVGMEYAHFFSALGVKTTVLQRPPKILPSEEPEVSDLLRLEMEKRLDIYTGFEVQEVKKTSDGKVVVAKSREDGGLREFTAEEVMIAAGRISNADLVKPENTGVRLDDRGFIIVNDALETSKKNIYAFGDAIGKAMFKHAANYEAGIAWHNSMHEHRINMDFNLVPHAIFTYPQVASVGLKETEAKKQGYNILVGLAFYRETAMGGAMGEPAGFVKVIVEKEKGKILGAHVIGPEASVLIQQIINCMVIPPAAFAPIVRAMYIHPAMSEVVQNAFGNLRPA